jgi:hypothetical protein
LPCSLKPFSRLGSSPFRQFLQQCGKDLPSLWLLQPSGDRIAMKPEASGNFAYWHSLRGHSRNVEVPRAFLSAHDCISSISSTWQI